MNRRLEIIIAAIVLILLILFVGWLIFRNRGGAPVEEEREIPVADDRPDVPEVAEDSVPKVNTVSATTIATVFVERFGSYSSESDFANVDDVALLATESFQNELERMAANARKNADDGDAYYGVSTRVISTSMKSETDTKATLYVMTQREEAVGSPGNTTVKYQNITVELVKVGDDWLVDGFAWEE